MNERIRELAEQAVTEKLSLDEFIAALKKEPYDFYGFRRCELEKFAELIVQECISVRTELTQFDGTTKYGDGYENGLKDMAEVIAKIFVVEE